MTVRTPIACTLSLGQYAERLAWIAELNGSLRHYERCGLALELHYPAEFVMRIRELVQRESSCCAFLRFEIEASSRETVLRILAPEETRDVVAAVLAPFLSGVQDIERTQTTDAIARAGAGSTRSVRD